MKAIKRPDGYRSRRYILKGDTPLLEVELIAQGSDWQRILDRPAAPEQNKDRLVKWELAAGLRVSYVEDSALQCAYIIITSWLGAQEVETAAAVFEVHPKIFRFQELIAAVDSADNTETKALAIARAGLGSPLEPQDDFVERITGAAREQDPILREGALWAITYTEWNLFNPLVQDMADNDPDEFVRGLAVRVLDVIDKLRLET
ncbi:hypothetical protein [Saccharothrix coeruleofusca]|uniref:HEAT repeat domain-containing protein n=1 Tax=Saccharothrix coeruleofusca TaxID=33919 RepID=A0A918ALA2_9PSEU|nr:hypothetical protein [Saccharothrix coeruleofusca]GGP52328.1 hypothetical protein GCM10010185_25520 [Saccharothrix coeruleofusca]